jgi:hypothetical protein
VRYDLTSAAAIQATIAIRLRGNPDLSEQLILERAVRKQRSLLLEALLLLRNLSCNVMNAAFATAWRCSSFRYGGSAIGLSVTDAWAGPQPVIAWTVRLFSC